MRCPNCREGELESKAITRDLRRLIGLPVRVKNFPVLVCPKCKAETLRGGVVDTISMHVVAAILESGDPLEPAEIKFLRSVLGYTQEELATHLGVSRVAVARWETSDGALDGVNAYALRSLVFFRLREANPPIEKVARSFIQPPKSKRAAKQRQYELARIFHERYEALAPFYGYQTRPESAVDWDRVPEANRRLMIQVCRQVLTRIEEEVHRTTGNPSTIGVTFVLLTHKELEELHAAFADMVVF